MRENTAAEQKPTVYTYTLKPSATVAEACQRFFDDLHSWIQDCIERYQDEPATDVHDQGTFTTGWAPYIQASDDQEALVFMKDLRDKIRDHYVASDQWRHGYWRMQEAHHGTEHFELFLGTLLRLDGDDVETVHQILDAAEHMGNWSSDVPPWFDWETGSFRSIFFGTDGARSQPEMALNTPDHLRCVNICLLAFDASEQQRYLDLASLYARRWAQAILAEERFPIGLLDASPVYAFSDADEALYRSLVGQATDLVSPVDRAENFLTSDAINAFLKLARLTEEGVFRRAAQRLLDVLVTQLGDPDAGAAAAAVRDYRTQTGDTRYDAAVLATVDELDSYAIRTLTLDVTSRLAERPNGIGKRSDMPRWLEDGVPRRHNPITLAVAAEISLDPQLATRAVDLARAYFLLAREAFPDGRDHGCAARTVSAIARGHGRDNHAGMTTAVLRPIWEVWNDHEDEN